MEADPPSRVLTVPCSAVGARQWYRQADLCPFSTRSTSLRPLLYLKRKPPEHVCSRAAIPASSSFSLRSPMLRRGHHQSAAVVALPLKACDAVSQFGKGRKCEIKMVTTFSQKQPRKKHFLVLMLRNIGKFRGRGSFKIWPR